MGWTLTLQGCTSLKELSQGLKVGRDLDLSETDIKELPQGLKVGRDLVLFGCTSLKELPQGLEVSGNLWLDNTPISKKYTREEIRKMIEDDGGFVNRSIFTSI